MVERLKKRYDSFNDVELFIGGMLEYDAEGSLIGPTLQAIVAEQFCRFQLGDRLYFEAKNQPYPFKECAFVFTKLYSCMYNNKKQIGVRGSGYLRNWFTADLRIDSTKVIKVTKVVIKKYTYF